MESRLLLSGTVQVEVATASQAANRAYLSSLEDSFMTGPLAPRRESALLAELDAGKPRTGVVGQFLKTPEAISAQANGFYRKLYGRGASPQEVARLGAILRAGGDLRNLYVREASTPEFARARGAATPAGFVTAIYRDVLQRSPKNGESLLWLGRLRAGESRTQVVRALVNTREARARLVLGAPIDLGKILTAPAAQQIAARPGGLNVLMARAFAAQSYFDSSTLPNATAPPPTDSGPQIHPPGLPMASNLDLGTRWTPLTTQNGPTFDGTNLVSAAPDGTIWATGPSGAHDQLYIYSPGTYAAQGGVSLLAGWVAVPKLTSPLASLSALSSSQAKGLAPIGGGNHFVAIDSAGHLTDEGAPPDATPVLSSSATDGTLLTYFNNELITVEYSGQDYPTFIGLPAGFLLQSFSAGSTSNIWAVANRYPSSTPMILHLINNLWQVDPIVPGASPTHVAAAADGSVWAWDANNVYLRSATTGVWAQATKTIIGKDDLPTTSPVTPPSPMTYGTAISQYRLAVVLADGSLQILSEGAVDQQAVPILPTDAQQLLAYRAISTYLNAVSPDGIRGDYDNSGQKSRIATDAADGIPDSVRPASVDPSVWGPFKKQILAELGYVGQVYTLFDTLGNVKSDIQKNNNTILPGILSNVEADVTEPISDSTTIGLVIGNGIEAALWGLAAVDTGGLAILGGIVASSFGSALSFVSNTPNPDSNTKLDIAFGALTTTLSTLYRHIDEENFNYETSVLTDWARLTAVGRAINDPKSPWATQAGASKIAADNAQPGFELFFYQSLVPAKWQAVYAPKVECIASFLWVTCPKPSIPGYDVIATVVGQNSVGPITDFRFLNELGGVTNVTGDLYPIPSSALLQAIYALGVSKQTLFSAQDNWNLKLQTGGY